MRQENKNSTFINPKNRLEIQKNKNMRHFKVIYKYTLTYDGYDYENGISNLEYFRRSVEEQKVMDNICNSYHIYRKQGRSFGQQKNKIIIKVIEKYYDNFFWYEEVSPQEAEKLIFITKFWKGDEHEGDSVYRAVDFELPVIF